MAKRIYFETIKKWLIGLGLVSGTLVVSLFGYLNFLGIIDITGYSGDMVCAGTESDPCYAYINLTAKEDIFIYPVDYDPWGRDTPFEFDPGVKSWKLQRSWGDGWRNIPLNKTCAGKWCGAPNNLGVKYSFVMREGRDYQFRIVAYKNSPTDVVKWSVDYEDKEYLDPVWDSVDKKKQITYTPTTDTICENGTCTKILYSGIRNVYEDETWKRVEDARSLKGKGFEFVYLEKDDNYEIEIEDFNYTCIKKLKLKSEVAGNIPFKIKGVEFISSYMEEGEEIELENICMDNILGYNFTLGESSTTIKLQTADTENLADVVMLDEVGGEFYLGFQIKWNISSIPSGKIIDDSTLCLYNEETEGTLDDDVNLSRVNDQAWDESSNAGDLDAQSLTNSVIGTLSSISTATWVCMNVTEIINVDYLAENDNSSIRGFDHDKEFTEIEYVYDGEYMDFGFANEPGATLHFVDKEDEESTGNLPYLNITYSEAPPEDTCTYSSGNWLIECSDMCNLSTNTDVLGNNILFNGTGYTTITANISNFSHVQIKGQDGANKCIVHIESGGGLNS
ncbi:MAG: CBM96 family carbohydrate-binding protein [Candidatus Heimdallarchaeaceae archaeon]